MLSNSGNCSNLISYCMKTIKWRDLRKYECEAEKKKVMK